MGWDDFCPASLSMELLKWFHKFPLLVKIVDKTTLPSSTLSLLQVLVLFINFICEIKNMNVFDNLRLSVRKHQREKQQLILRPDSLKLLEIT